MNLEEINKTMISGWIENKPFSKEAIEEIEAILSKENIPPIEFKDLMDKVKSI